jgi:hypothetical protein
MRVVLVLIVLLVVSIASEPQKETLKKTKGTVQEPIVTNITDYFLRTIERLRGEDDRLFRWDATEQTVQVQKQVCEDAMDRASLALLEKTSSSLLLPLEIFAWCLTDQPRFREQFSEFPQLFEIILDLLKPPLPSSSDKDHEDKNAIATFTMAAQVIYRAVYGNAYNYAMFQSAIPTLADIILQYHNNQNNNKYYSPVSVMWAAAAMQNLAANYCQKDIICHYDWTDDNNDKNDTVRLEPPPFNGKLLVNGTVARQTIIATPHLVETLVELACQGPVKGSPNETHNPFIGENAKQQFFDTTTANNHHSIPAANLWAWAATGVLKQLALEPNQPSLKSMLESHAVCWCHLLYSKDWLEAIKANDLWHHLRRTDPCWYQGIENPEQYREELIDTIDDIRTVPLCIDDAHYRDSEGWTCGDFEHDEVVEDPTLCDVKDARRTDVTARHACCICGGGTGAKINLNTSRPETTPTSPKTTTKEEL